VTTTTVVCVSKMTLLTDNCNFDACARVNARGRPIDGRILSVRIYKCQAVPSRLHFAVVESRRNRRRRKSSLLLGAMNTNDGTKDADHARLTSSFDSLHASPPPPPVVVVVAPVVVDSFATTAALARSNSLVNAKRSVNPHSTSSNRRSDAPSLSSSSSRNVNRSITRADDPIPRPSDVGIVVSDVPARTPILHETSTNDVGIVRIKNSNARQSEART
jgi:hypothetical protein